MTAIPYSIVANENNLPNLADALALVAYLQQSLGEKRKNLLAKRVIRQAELDSGVKLDFLPQTKTIRESHWRVKPIPSDLQDRRVEITGPVDRKMVINALNSGARCFMADFEDSHSPTWEGTLAGHQNMFDAVRGTIDFTSPEGKHYKLNDQTAALPPTTLIVRPRGWHLDEAHMQMQGEPVSGSLFDFGIFFYLNAHALLAKGSGPYFYLPKLESHEEARLWAEAFALAEEYTGLPRGTISCTVLVETLPASFELHEILWELRDYIVALNCGRWDYIFSAIKKRRADGSFMLPDRGQVTMTAHMMRSYSRLVIQTCHKRGAMAMGGMSAFIPVKDDKAANDKALAQVKADKEREATDGHDGTWVAHPALVPVAMEVFDRLMPTPNNLHLLREEFTITRDDLLATPEGTITEAGVRGNIQVSLRYLASWLNGQGCVPIFNLMEDAATAEISRTQLWQWLNHGAKLDSGKPITLDWLKQVMEEEKKSLLQHIPAGYSQPKIERAYLLLDEMVFAPDCRDFLTLPAYQSLIASQHETGDSSHVQSQGPRKAA